MFFLQVWGSNIKIVLAKDLSSIENQIEDENFRTEISELI